MAAMIEFAGILLIQRKNHLNRRNRVTTDGELQRRGSFEMDELNAKIDFLTLILLSLGYILYNIAYCAIYVI